MGRRFNEIAAVGSMFIAGCGAALDLGKINFPRAEVDPVELCEKIGAHPQIQDRAVESCQDPPEGYVWRQRKVVGILNGVRVGVRCVYFVKKNSRDPADRVVNAVDAEDRRNGTTDFHRDYLNEEGDSGPDGLVDLTTVNAKEGTCYLPNPESVDRGSQSRFREIISAVGAALKRKLGF